MRLSCQIFSVLFVTLFALSSSAQNTTTTTTAINTTLKPATSTTQGPSAKETQAQTESEEGAETKPKKKKMRRKRFKRIYARLHTSMGRITMKLYKGRAPETVKNFVGLAEGTIESLNYETKEKEKKPYYDGLIFHRVMPNFLIQSGCLLGNGKGGPGHTIKDEILPELQFDRPGLLAMANEGKKDTGGGQFFIVLRESPFLDGKYTIFGEVTAGLEIAQAISNAKTSIGTEKPEEPIKLERVEIIRR
jgi:peptidyl-prolyl cis-trans isomerase A (cyclophilin A)